MAEHGEQLELIRRRVRRPPAPRTFTPAPELPIARVVVDVPLAHLDRLFDYRVPASMHESCVPGCRVRVRFAGQEVDGFVLERVARSEHGGRLVPLRRVVSAEPVLSPEVARVARLIADRYAGTLYDVLRLAVPPRHARVEDEETVAPANAGGPDARAVAEAEARWQEYEAGTAFLAALRRGDSPRAVWTALPAEDWSGCLAAAAAATLASGRGVVIVVPDHRDVTRLDRACRRILGGGRHVVLTAELGPAERYRRFLAARRARVRCVIGTRAAALAPVADLGLVVCWDDGDDLHAEPRAPYPHVREMLALRAHDARSAALIAGYACTAEGAQLVESGWARRLGPAREAVRARAPRVFAVGDSDVELARDPVARAVRLPHRAFEVARAALADGPVLVQVPRGGYVPALACQDCRERARCAACSGPLQLGSARQPAACAWCGRPATAWRCPQCGGARFRAPVIGSRRTAEELGRAFPTVPVRVSGGDRVLAEVGPKPALVIATPGAEPVAEGGYAAALLLDGWLLLMRADLRAGEETLRRWLNAAALVRPGSAGGAVVVTGESALPVVQALVRWSPGWYAERELAERQAAGFPPAVRLATIEGPSEAVRETAELLEPPPSAEVLGPVPIPSGEGDEETARLIVRTPRGDGAALAAALKAAQARRSADKAAGTVRVRVDPHALG